MPGPQATPAAARQRVLRELLNLFNLRRDQAEPEDIDAAIRDGALIRQSAVNLAVFVALSLAASTAYFALSPLTQAHSELLARTSPSV